MSHQREPVRLEVVILGGGAAGLWLLDDLVRRGHHVLLLEAADLGCGQTIASQGIIHGGLKYSLGGLLTPSARAVREMPVRWRRSLAGEVRPDLRHTRLRAEFCHLWRTGNLGGRIGMLGARIGLQVAPSSLERPARPPALLEAAEVWRLDEQVIEPASFLGNLADQHPARIVQIDARDGLELVTEAPGQVTAIRLRRPGGDDPVELRPRWVVLTAGAGNAALSRQLGLDGPAMQRRPLHMVLARGDLPVMNGHCVDGTSTRLTITTSHDCEERVVWQVGGQIAERGVDLDPADLIAEARREVAECLPGVDLGTAEWTTYRVDRAEAGAGRGVRPDQPHVAVAGNTVTAWPTKLALVPMLSEMILERLDLDPPRGADPGPAVEGFPRPAVALPPWELIDRWTRD